MKRIFASLFVVAAIVGVGVLATGAYFTDTVNNTNYTFNTGSADLKLGLCGEIGADCHLTPANLDSLDMSTLGLPPSETLTGPGIEHSGCLVIENKGDYALKLTGRLVVTDYDHAGMLQAFQVALNAASNGCNPVGNVVPWTSVGSVVNPIDSGVTLAPGDRFYAIFYNRWDSTGDQNALQGKFVKFNMYFDGKTQ